MSNMDVEVPCREAERWPQRQIGDRIDPSKSELNNLVCFLTQQ